MLEIASQMILCLLLAALLGFIIGYLLGKSTCPDDDCGHTHKDTHATVKKADTHTSHEHTENIAKVHSGTSNTSSLSKNDTKAPLVQTEVEASGGTEPMLLSGPRNGQKDNLTRIKGIGLKIDEKLNSMGIYHFDQIASWSAEEAAWVDSQTAFPGRVQREHWVAQAKALAAGEETEFSKRVDKGEVASSKKA